MFIIQINKKYFKNNVKLYNLIKYHNFFIDLYKIFNKSYEHILDKAKQGDFVFLDPPYIESTNYKFNYNKDKILYNSFIQQLFLQVKKLDERNVKWLMTQANTPQIKDVFKNYTIETFKLYRSSSKSYVNELLIMNYEI